MTTMSPEAETNKNENTSQKFTNSENKQTTMARFSSTEGKSTSANYTLKTTTIENKPITKAVTDEDDEQEATGLATNHFLSINAISIMFVSFFLNV